MVVMVGWIYNIFLGVTNESQIEIKLWRKGLGV